MPNMNRSSCTAQPSPLLFDGEASNRNAVSNVNLESNAAAADVVDSVVTENEIDTNTDTDTECNRKSLEVLSLLLTETERCFLRKDYRQSLHLVNRFFRTRTSINSRSRSRSRSPTSSSAPTNRKGNKRQLNRKERRKEDGTTDSIQLFPSIKTVLSVPNNNSRKSHCSRNQIQKQFTFATHATFESEESSTAQVGTSTPSSTERCETPNEATLVDRLAAIGLQSWHELSRMEERRRSKQYHRGTKKTKAETIANKKKDCIPDADRWTFLVPILDFYNHHAAGIKVDDPMDPEEAENRFDATKESSVLHPNYAMHESGSLSLEFLATVWIPFWEFHGYGLQAFLWTIQTLDLSFSTTAVCTSTAATSPPAPTPPSTPASPLASPPAPLTAIKDELWLRCVCKQIPMHMKNNPELARNILDTISGWNETSIGGNALERIWDYVNSNCNCNANSKDDKLLLNCLIDTLDGYLNRAQSVSDETSTSFTASPENNSIPATGVSRRTLVRARDFLFQQKHEGQKQRKQQQQQHQHQHQHQQNRERNGLCLSKENCDPEEHRKWSLDPTGQQQTTKKLHWASSHSNIDSDGNASFHSTLIVQSEPPPPTTTTTVSTLILVLVDALKKLPGKFRPPLIASISRAKAQKPLFHRAVTGSGDETATTSGRNEGKGKGNTQRIYHFVKLVGALFAVRVPDENESALEDSRVQEHEPIRIIRRHLKQVVLYFVLVSIGWRQRQFLCHTGNSLVSALFAPFRELLDALAPKQQRQHRSPTQPRTVRS